MPRAACASAMSGAIASARSLASTTIATFFALRSNHW
jgi:hypothetical protein